MAAKKLTLAQRAKKDPKLLARALADPGLRSKLPSSMLSPEQRQTRATNLRLKQPITPGSTITEGALAQEAQSAGDVRYGDVQTSNTRALGEEQARGRDLGGWYDQYLAAVAQHSRNVQGIGAQAGQIGLGLQQGVTGLGQAGLAMIQNPANADAASRGATAGNLAPMENQALAVRQALTGSFVAQQTAQNAATQGYADSMANVVAPGEKLGAMAQQAGKVKQAREDITNTAKQRGAWEETYRTGRRSDEAKNVLAAQIAGTNAADKKADNKAAANSKYGKGSPVPNSFGFTYDEWHRMTGKERNRWRSGAATRAPAKPPSTDGYGKGKTGMNEYGYTYDEWNKLPETERTKWRNGTNTKKADAAPLSPQETYARDFYKKYGVQPQSGAEVAKTREQRFPAITKALSDLQRPNARGKTMTLDEAGRLLAVGQPKGTIIVTKDNKDLYPGEKVGSKHTTRKIDAYPAVLIRVIMDQQRMGGAISAQTADRLHKAGYSVKQLGLRTVAGKTPISTGTGNPSSAAGTGLG